MSNYEKNNMSCWETPCTSHTEVKKAAPVPWQINNVSTTKGNAKKRTAIMRLEKFERQRTFQRQLQIPIAISTTAFGLK